ncbi:unnamed protein product [Gongylonema pulchrum]|uniref:MADS-box domain-containing protein n=1 Tax=Gongylonema pulchrum TaxID=637853 RepID=A0A183EDW8_9BILA|nr:unnamed protein product [Gongylonema pulchrum]
MCGACCYFKRFAPFDLDLEIIKYMQKHREVVRKRARLFQNTLRDVAVVSGKEHSWVLLVIDNFEEKKIEHGLSGMDHGDEDVPPAEQLGSRTSEIQVPAHQEQKRARPNPD